MDKGSFEDVQSTNDVKNDKQKKQPHHLPSHIFCMHTHTSFRLKPSPGQPAQTVARESHARN